MKKCLLYIFLLLTFLNGYSQEVPKLKTSGQPVNQSKHDSTKLSRNSQPLNAKAKIEQYLIFDSNGKSSYVDTSLTIQKEYKFNYLRKDNFGLLAFANLGQTYNELTKTYTNMSTLPDFGARARHFNYMEVDDIYYYEVPTPLTELFYKSAFQQGQLLDAFFTANLSKRLNFSVAYKGLRSLGNYQHQITSTGNLRFTANYKTTNNKYEVSTHFTSQDLSNEENGGLTDEDVLNFVSGNEDFIDRSVFDPNLQDAESILVGKRFYVNQKYHIISRHDSIGGSRLTLKNIFNFEDKYFEFQQNTSNDIFGDSFNESNIRNRATLENFHSKLSIEYQDEKIGILALGLNYNDINYGYDKVTILNDQIIPNRIKDQIISADGLYSNQFGPLFFESGAGVNVIGDFDGYFFTSKIDYKFSENLKINANFSINSAAPNYNTLLHQSDYLNYNWDNINDFENLNSYDFGFKLKSEKFFNISLNYTTIDNFTFFSRDINSGLIRPFQLEESIDHLKVRVDKELRLGKFALDNSVLYQNVNDGSNSHNLPEFVVRNTLYYSNHFFNNKALYLQTGITLNYFTEYFMDGYDPILAEFYTQNTMRLGGFPRLDFFVNLKIRQARIFFKAEHFNSSFTGYDYFSAPNIPYRDFTVRFGLVWNFFL